MLTATEIVRRSSFAGAVRGRHEVAMDPQLADILREIENSAQLNGGVPRLAREAGQFLNLLVKASHARQLLEIGVQDGYASLWLADAAAANDGQVISLESDVLRYELSRELLERSPHIARIQLLQGEIPELLPVIEGPFDFVLLNADSSAALGYFHIVFEKLTTGGLICCDNAISHAAALADYLAYVHDRPGLESVLVPVGEGIEVTFKAP